MKILRAGDTSFNNAWKKLLSDDTLCYPLHSQLNQQYYENYFDKSKFSDRSFLLINDDGPIAGLRICQSQESNGVVQLNAFGRPTFYVESSTAGIRSKQKAFSNMKKEINNICLVANIWEWHHFENLHQGKISPIGRYLLNNNAQQVPSWTQLINLHQNEKVLFAQLSKSFRSNVNWGRKNIELKIINENNIKSDHMDQFQNLHFKASERKTRNDKSWECQFNLVKNNEAFIIFGYLSDELVSAALFLHSNNYCLYGVSASQRMYFDKPISHSLVWTAIVHAKNLGCKIFDLAGQNFASDLPAPTGKQLSISKFKRSFGGNTNIQLVLNLSSQNSLSKISDDT